MTDILLTKAPAAPAHLDKIGRAAWKATASYLVARRLLHSGDLVTVDAFCMSYARLRALEALVAGNLTLPDGKVNPALTALNSTAGVVTKLAAMLALGPVTRGRLGAEARKVADEPDEAHWGDLLKPRAKYVRPS